MNSSETTNGRLLFGRGLAMPRFDSRKLAESYDEWYRQTRSGQLSAIAAVTGALYIVCAVLDWFFAPAEFLALMTTVHLLVMPPVLFATSALLYFEKSYRLGITALVLAPVVAAIGNVVIVTQLDEPAVYRTEIYLIVFWIFTVSGMRFYRAILSASLVGAVVLTATLFHYSLSPQVFAMHVFWMFSASAFGVMTSFFLERSSRTIFDYNTQLKTLAVTDGLTGLFNRTKLDEVLQDELNRSERFGNEFGVVVLDIDRFKSVNDEHGHLVGDEVLIEVARLLKGSIRKTDTVARWGGEEFLVLFTGVDAETTARLAEKLRGAIEAKSFTKVGTVTASLGTATYQKGDTIASILRRGDGALYEAKNGGRNRVVSG